MDVLLSNSIVVTLKTAHDHDDILEPLQNKTCSQITPALKSKTTAAAALKVNLINSKFVLFLCQVENFCCRRRMKQYGKKGVPQS